MKLQLSATWRSRLMAFGCFAAIAGAGYHFLWPAHGVRDVYLDSCNARVSIVVKSSAYSHPLDFGIGDAAGYGVFLRASDYPGDFPLYNDAFSARDYPGGFPLPYVGWRLGGKKWRKDAAHYERARPTYEFAPAPANFPPDQMRVFEPPSGTYTRDATPPETGTPLLMNIFVPVEKMSDASFSKLADCLGAHQNEINSALLRVRSDFPYRSRGFYRPLRLGAVVHGMPPWSDVEYVNQIRSIYGDTKSEKALPEGGLFTLYREQSARGLIDGKQVRLSVLSTGETQWVIDGAAFLNEPTRADVEKSGLRDVSAVQDGLQIGQSICHVRDMGNCAKMIQFHSWNSDGSTQFWMMLKAGTNTWVGDFPALAYWDKR